MYLPKTVRCNRKKHKKSKRMTYEILQSINTKDKLRKILVKADVSSDPHIFHIFPLSYPPSYPSYPLSYPSYYPHIPPHFPRITPVTHSYLERRRKLPVYQHPVHFLSDIDTLHRKPVVHDESSNEKTSYKHQQINNIYRDRSPISLVTPPPPPPPNNL